MAPGLGDFDFDFQHRAVGFFLLGFPPRLLPPRLLPLRLNFFLLDLTSSSSTSASVIWLTYLKILKDVYQAFKGATGDGRAGGGRVIRWRWMIRQRQSLAIRRHNRYGSRNTDSPPRASLLGIPSLFGIPATADPTPTAGWSGPPRPNLPNRRPHPGPHQHNLPDRWPELRCLRVPMPRAPPSMSPFPAPST